MESETSEGTRVSRIVLYCLLYGLAIAAPLWIAALDPVILASSYGKRFVPFELMGLSFAVSFAIVAWIELRDRRPLTWQAALPILLPLLVGLHTVVFFAELARKPFDYDCYEYAGRALLLGEDPYRVGLNYLYPPLTAQLFAAAARGVGVVAEIAGFTPTPDAVWDGVYYLYQCAQVGLVVGLYFLALRIARAFGLAGPWAPLLVAALLLFDNPLLRTLRHGQVNLWVLDLSLLAVCLARRFPAAAGAALALAAHIKIYPLVLLAPFAANRGGRGVLWTGVFLVAIFVLQTDLLRDTALWDQYRAFMAGTYPGEFAFRNASFHSMAVNLLRFVAGVAPRDHKSEVQIAASFFSAAMVVWLLLRIWRRQRSSEGDRRFFADAADALAFSLLISQSVWEHHYVFALPLMLHAIALRGRDASFAVACAGLLAFWMPTFDLFPLGYHRVVGLGMLLWLTRSRRRAPLA